MLCMTEWRDNYGVQISGPNERIEQQDTSLSDLDVTIMTQYQIVAGIFGVPATKLMGTPPKGFQATGEHEIENYHEELETIQENDLTPIVLRHLTCLMRSKIAPMLPDRKPLHIDILWNPLAVQTAREQAETQELKARTYKLIQESGAIDAYDIRDRIISDEESAFSGIEAVERPEDEPLDLAYKEAFEDPQEPQSWQQSAQEEADQVTHPIEPEELTSKPTGKDVMQREGSKWVVRSEEGKLLGRYNTKHKAKQRLRQVEYFKNK